VDSSQPINALILLEDLMQVINPASIAAEAFDLLLPYIKEIVDVGWQSMRETIPAGVRHLCKAVFDTLYSKPAGRDVITELRKTPNDADVQAALRIQLRIALQDRETYLAQIKRLLEYAKTEGGGFRAAQTGDGAIAQGSSSRAVGAGGMMIEGGIGGDVVAPKQDGG
jgi:hypothetical protein